jgi:hypothetical protein
MVIDETLKPAFAHRLRTGRQVQGDKSIRHCDPPLAEKQFLSHSSWDSFVCQGGLKMTGNENPSGLFIIFYCIFLHFYYTVHVLSFDTIHDDF